jgi:glucose-6-phosphate isomerase
MQKIIPYDLPLRVQIDFQSGEFSPSKDWFERRLSQLAESFHDQEAVAGILKSDDPLIYDVHYQPFITSLSDLVFGVTRIYPGKVGDEYHMTKGHFHLLPDEAEIYICFQGQGCLVMESAEGDFKAHWWSPGSLSHIPPGYAHRTVNVGAEPLIFGAVYHLRAGHDYASIAQRGFSHLVVEQDGKPALVPNPRR